MTIGQTKRLTSFNPGSRISEAEVYRKDVKQSESRTAAARAPDVVGEPRSITRTETYAGVREFVSPCELDQTRLSSFQLTNAPTKVSSLAVPPTNLWGALNFSF